jgi:hypothetical protein
MFLNKRCPLSVKVKSKKAELFLLMKTDAVEISMNFPKIWRKIIKNSLFNMQQLDRLINKTLKFFFIHFEGKDKFKTLIRQTSLGNSFSSSNHSGILNGIYNNSQKSIEDLVNENDDELMSIPEESDDDKDELDQIKEESDENEDDSSTIKKNSSNNEMTESNFSNNNHNSNSYSSSLLVKSSSENEESEKSNETKNNSNDEMINSNENNLNSNLNSINNDNNSNLNSRKSNMKLKEVKKNPSNFQILTKNKERKSISFLVKNLNEIEVEKNSYINDYSNNNSINNNTSEYLLNTINSGNNNPYIENNYYNHHKNSVYSNSSSLFGVSTNDSDYCGSLSSMSNNNINSFERNNSILEKNFKLIVDIRRVIFLEDKRTTIMIKNIPNKFTGDFLLNIIDQNFKGTFNLFILPTDTNKCKNFGYAFINFTSSYFIPYFYYMFNGKMWSSTNSQKVCKLTYSKIQGKKGLISHYIGKIVYQNDSLRVNSEQKFIIPNEFGYIFRQAFPKQYIEEYKYYFLTKIPGKK